MRSEPRARVPWSDDLSERADATARGAYVLYEHALMRIAAVVEEEQLSVLLVKGAALATMVYPKPWLRRMGDIDLLVREADRERLLTALEHAGFRAEHARADRRYSRALLGESALVFPMGDAEVLVEVHHRFHKIIPFAVDYEAIFSRAQPVPGCPALLAPEPTDHVLLVTLHAALSEFRHEPAWRDLELLFASHVDAEALERRATAWGLRTAFFFALFTLQRRGCPNVPAGLVNRVAPKPLRRKAAKVLFDRGPWLLRSGKPRRGASWVLAQAALRDTWSPWIDGTLRYAAVRLLDKLPSLEAAAGWAERLANTKSTELKDAGGSSS